jgi:hypothetical protein
MGFVGDRVRDDHTGIAISKCDCKKKTNLKDYNLTGYI